MTIADFLTLEKTIDSQLCLDVFRSNKAISISHKNWHFATRLLSQSCDNEKMEEATKKLLNFIAFLDGKKLKCTQFYFGYNSETEKYIFSYTVRSLKFNNPDFKVDGSFDGDNILFAFFPQMFAKFLFDVLSEVPYSALIEVSKGK